MNIEQFKSLPTFLQDQILSDTFDTFQGKQISSDREYGDISLQNLINEERCPAIAARMTSKPLWISKYEIIDDNIVMNRNVIPKTYTGQDIADIFINSCRKNGFCYYPIKAKQWKKNGIKQIYLFVKNDNRYSAYARFDIDEVIASSFDISMYNTLIDISPTVSIASEAQIALKISNVKTENLPSDFVGIASASKYWFIEDKNGEKIIDPKTKKPKTEIRLQSIYCKGGAFSGSSPNIEIL